MRINLQPSGLNNSFLGADLTFHEYIACMQEIICQSQTQLNSELLTSKIQMNSPFELQKNTSAPKMGVLLIHGLFGSPFYVQDVARYLANQGLLAKAILLPGHGTVPGDLLNIDYREWIKAVDYGVASFKNEVTQIYLIGYSLGGTLAVHHYLKSQQQSFIKGLILFAPAIKPKSLLKNAIVRYHYLFSWAHTYAKWYQIKPQGNLAKYSSYTLNAGAQACKLIDQVQSLLKTKTIPAPFFITMSFEDETISRQAIIDLFYSQSNPLNKLLIYAKHPNVIKDPRIIQKPSAYPELKILDFSHSCLTIAPNNAYLGKNACYQDMEHYSNPINNPREFYLGAASQKNIKNHLLLRLSYNPDFDNLMQSISNFLEET